MPLVANRTVNGTIMFTVVVVLALTVWRRSGAGAGAWRTGLRFAIAGGVIDALANMGLLLGVRLGDLSVMAVLTELYPAGTIILAAD